MGEKAKPTKYLFDDLLLHLECIEYSLALVSFGVTDLANIVFIEEEAKQQALDTIKKLANLHKHCNLVRKREQKRCH